MISRASLSSSRPTMRRDSSRRKSATLGGSDYPADRLTLLIGSDGSSDSTPEILRGHTTPPPANAQIFTRRRGKVSVVNDLMAEVEADIVILSDANTMLAT